MNITRIAEEMIRREYLKKSVTLPAKFWNLPEYKPKYQMQMRLGAKFIRTYGEDAVTNVINRETWCFSLAAKKLPDMFELEASRLKRVALADKKQEVVEKIDPEIPLFRKLEGKKPSLLDE